MREKFIKYLNNECSPEEVKELLASFKVAENETVLRALITDSLETIDSEDDDSRWQPSTDKVLAVIRKQVLSEQPKVVPFFQKAWLRVAAAVIIITGGFAIYSAIDKANEKQEVVSKEGLKGEISPGTNKAVLTLADGSAIMLESAENGELAEQGHVEIMKLADGQISYNALNEKPGEGLINSITTPRGGQYQLILSDGTKVWLNAASSLHFPVAFAGNERKVELIGEGYFEVAKAQSMPFKVAIAGKGEVEVLGTHFNISAYPDGKTINTTLLEGSVKVKALSTMDARILSPGQQARLDNKGEIKIVKKVDTIQATSWKKGTFNFTNADLATVFREISRWYDVDIQFEGDSTKRQFTGEIQRDWKLSQVLKLLKRNNVFCRLEGKTLIVL